jgi:hypothetical protein
LRRWRSAAGPARPTPGDLKAFSARGEDSFLIIYQQQIGMQFDRKAIAASSPASRVCEAIWAK